MQAILTSVELGFQEMQLLEKKIAPVYDYMIQTEVEFIPFSVLTDFLYEHRDWYAKAVQTTDRIKLTGLGRHNQMSSLESEDFEAYFGFMPNKDDEFFWEF